MTISEISSVLGLSKALVRGVIKGTYNHEIDSDTKEAIMFFSEFEKGFLFKFFVSDVFIQLCDCGISRGNVKVRESAAVAKHIVLNIMSRSITSDKNKDDELS
jgi:hypothetical protein